MTRTITVSFGQNGEYEFRVSDADAGSTTREDAGHWLHAEYHALEWESRNPVGKILLLDVILAVAKYGGQARFAEGGDWARRFAQCCAAALGRDVRVDVLNQVVG